MCDNITHCCGQPSGGMWASSLLVVWWYGTRFSVGCFNPDVGRRWLTWKKSWDYNPPSSHQRNTTHDAQGRMIDCAFTVLSPRECEMPVPSHRPINPRSRIASPTVSNGSSRLSHALPYRPQGLGKSGSERLSLLLFLHVLRNESSILLKQISISIPSWLTRRSQSPKSPFTGEYVVKRMMYSD